MIVVATTLLAARSEAAAPRASGSVSSDGTVDSDGDDDDDRDRMGDDLGDADGNNDNDGDNDDDNVDGAEDTRLRVHVDTEVLGGAWSRTEAADGSGNEDTISFGGGLARPSLLDNGTAVFSRPVFGFGLGYVFADDHAVLGAKLAFTVDGYNIDSDANTVALGGRFVPYFQWMFMPEHWVRPYVEVRVGFGGSSATQDLEDTGKTTGLVIYPMVGAGGGLHLFPREWFSVDLGLNVDYVAPYTRTTYRDDDQDDTDFDKAADVVNFGVLLGMSVWFGDNNDHRREQRRVAARSRSN
ncbi:MAG: hypothetical protein IAG13_28290 [Deltaproteobacteria bacterium]|nr:hypothetical protein [Nannocystaceae bacterium]